MSYHVLDREIFGYHTVPYFFDKPRFGFHFSSTNCHVDPCRPFQAWLVSPHSLRVAARQDFVAQAMIVNSSCGTQQQQLVGGIPTPLKNMKVNGKDYPIYIYVCIYIYIMENKKCSKPPTRQTWAKHEPCNAGPQAPSCEKLRWNSSVNWVYGSWWFPEIGVPPVIILFIDGFSIKKTIQLLGYPHLWKPPNKTNYN